jgi:hypothetical protein
LGCAGLATAPATVVQVQGSTSLAFHNVATTSRSVHQVRPCQTTLPDSAGFYAPITIDTKLGRATLPALKPCTLRICRLYQCSGIEQRLSDQALSSRVFPGNPQASTLDLSCMSSCRVKACRSCRGSAGTRHARPGFGRAAPCSGKLPHCLQIAARCRCGTVPCSTVSYCESYSESLQTTPWLAGIPAFGFQRLSCCGSGTVWFVAVAAPPGVVVQCPAWGVSSSLPMGFLLQKVGT